METAALLALFVSALVLGTTAAHAIRTAPDYSQPEFNRLVFGAALMSVCGRGATTPNVPIRMSSETPAALGPMVEFLGGRRESISCGEIPGDVQGLGLDAMQSAAPNLRRAITMAWGAWRVSWIAVDRLFGVMFAVTVTAAYVAARCTIGPVFAGAAALLLMLSPLQLTSLGDLRDYSKAPFFSLTALALVAVTVRRRAPAAVIAVAAACGALLGLGFGFRTDIALNICPLVAAMALFLPGPLRESWKLRVVASLTCVLAFVAAAFPLLVASESRGNIWHWAMLGFADEFDKALHLQPGSYAIGHFYNDSYVATVVSAYWSRISPAHGAVTLGFADYATAGREYYMRLVHTFPADMCVRALAAIMGVLELPFASIQRVSAGVLPKWLENVAGDRSSLLTVFNGSGLLLFLAAVGGVAVSNVRLAAMILTTTAFWGAYPAVQFQRRHVFHLEWLGIWLLMFCAAGVITLAWNTARSRAFDVAVVARVLIRPAALLLAVVSFVSLTLVSLRAHQQGEAIDLFERYERAAVTVLDSQPTTPAVGMVRLEFAPLSFAAPRGRGIASDMLVVDLSAACSADRIALRFRFAGDAGALDLSQTVDVEKPQTSGGTQVFFPLFQSAGDTAGINALRFLGIELVESERPCVNRIGRFSNPENFPVLIQAVLRPSWREEPLHETLAGWPSVAAPLRPPRSYWAPSALRGRDVVLRQALRTPWQSTGTAISYRARIATMTAGGGVSVGGVAEGPLTYLVAWAPVLIKDSSTIRVDGTLVRGGVSVGLTSSEGWGSRVDIDDLGPFQAYLAPERTGQYQLVIASHSSDILLSEKLTISRVALLGAADSER